MVVSAATVTGLLVLALSAVLGATTWATGVFGAGSAESAPAESAAPTGAPDSDDPAADDGLVYLGDGVLVPAGGPGDCMTSARINIMVEDDGP